VTVSSLEVKVAEALLGAFRSWRGGKGGTGTVSPWGGCWPGTRRRVVVMILKATGRGEEKKKGGGAGSISSYSTPS